MAAVGGKGFYQFMSQYEVFMGDMVALEDDKYKALISCDVGRIDRAITEQQAMLMKLEKLEEERMAMQGEIGWDGCTFTQILEKVEDELRDPMTRLFEKISRHVEAIQYSNHKAMSFAKMNLQLNEDDIGVHNYSDRRPKEYESSSVFEKKI